MTAPSETILHGGLIGPSGAPLTAMFTGPRADEAADLWLAQVHAGRAAIKARVARQAGREPRRARRGEVAA